MGYVGCYSIDLYCDHSDHDRATGMTSTRYALNQYTGRTEGGCFRDARRDGWLISKKREGKNQLGNGFCLCPNHSGKRKAKGE